METGLAVHANVYRSRQTRFMDTHFRTCSSNQLTAQMFIRKGPRVCASPLLSMLYMVETEIGNFQVTFNPLYNTA